MNHQPAFEPSDGLESSWIPWNHVQKGVGLLLALLLMGGVRVAWSAFDWDPQTFSDVGTFVAVACVLVSIVVTQGVFVRLGLTEPMRDWNRQQKRLFVVGFGLAVVLSLGLSVYEYNSSQMQRRSAQNAAAQREILGRSAQSADVHAGAEAMRRAPGK